MFSGLEYSFMMIGGVGIGVLGITLIISGLFGHISRYLELQRKIATANKRVDTN